MINKPAGLVVHPAAGIQFRHARQRIGLSFSTTLELPAPFVPALCIVWTKILPDFWSPPRPNQLTRTSADQFRAREVFKSYVALVYGVVKQESGRIEQPIARDPRNRTRMAIVPGGRGALSLYKVRRSYDRFTLLDVELKTGRTHQIRVHLSWLKHPVVGDELYGGGRDNSVQDVQLRARIRKLQATVSACRTVRLSASSDGEPLQFVAPLPAELTQFLEELGAR